jgi:hypothetical protein
MKRVSILFSATALSALAMITGQACSSEDDTSQDVGNLMGTGGTTPVGAAGSAATPAAGAGGGAPSSGATPAPSGAAGTEGSSPLAPPAAGGSANAGAGAAGAAGGMADAAAGAAGASMGAAGSNGIPVPPPETPCPAAPSPSNGGACVITCTDDCGVFGIGARLCTCTDGVFGCDSCGFDGVVDPLIEPPDGPLPPCDLIDEQQEDDESGCEENERCQSIGREDPAANFENRFCACRGGEWDCDTKPASFGG